jgi:hypothetical protein
VTKTQHDDRKVFDDTATSIKELVVQLENRESDGRPVTSSEIQTIAGRLQIHVEDLLAALRSLREKKSQP